MNDRDALEIEQIRATIDKLNAETTKLQSRTRYPPVIVAALVISVLGIVAQIVNAIFGGAP